MAGAVAVQCREDAVLLRQRPEAVLSLLLLGQARRHLHLPDGDGGAVLPGGGGAAGGRGRASPCRSSRARTGARRSSGATPLRRRWSWPPPSSRRRCKGRSARKARDYLAGRGLGGETQERFRIGYAPPDRYALRDHLAGKGVDVELMVEAGLLVTGEDVAVPYDRFRDRVMFPIRDVRGRVIAFGGRAHGADVPAKYLNSPETPLFHKGARPLQSPQGPQGRPRARHRHRGRGLCRRDRHERRRLSADRGAARHGADRGPARAALAACPTSRSSASTATRPAARPPTGRSTWRCRTARRRASPCASRSCPKGRTRTISPAPAARGGDRAGARGARPLVDMLWAREIEAGPLDTPERRAALERRLRESLALIRDETLKRLLSGGDRGAACAALTSRFAAPIAFSRRRRRLGRDRARRQPHSGRRVSVVAAARPQRAVHRRAARDARARR